MGRARAQDGSKEIVFDHEHVNRSTLRVKTRQWLAARYAPKRYGEKLEIEHSDPGADADRAMALDVCRRLAYLLETNASDMPVIDVTPVVEAKGE